MSIVVREAGLGDEHRLALVGAATFLESYAGVLSGDDIIAHCVTKHSPVVYEDWLIGGEVRIWLAEAEEGRAPVVRSMRIGYAAAAAIVVSIISVFLVVKQSGGGEIKDTYDDPEKAFAAVQRALLVASEHMKEGENITQKNMHRLNNNFNVYEQLK